MFVCSHFVARWQRGLFISYLRIYLSYVFLLHLRKRVLSQIKSIHHFLLFLVWFLVIVSLWNFWSLYWAGQYFSKHLSIILDVPIVISRLSVSDLIWLNLLYTPPWSYPLRSRASWSASGGWFSDFWIYKSTTTHT